MAGTGIEAGYLDAWRSRVLKDMKQRLPRMLEDAGEALLTTAERAKNNQLQTMLFHGFQSLHRRHNQVVADCLAELGRLMTRPASTEKPAPNGNSPIDLVNPELFERSVSLQRFSDRAEQEHYRVLHELRLRLSALHNGVPIEYDAIPAGPRQLVSAFDHALRPLKLEQPAADALHAFFQASFLGGFAGEHYQALNDQLREAGYLPNFRYQIQKQATLSPRRASGRKEEPAPPDMTPQQPADGPTVPPAARTAEAQMVHDIRSLLPQQASGNMVVNPLSAQQIAKVIAEQHDQLAGFLPEHGVFTSPNGNIALTPAQLNETLRALVRQRQEIKRLVGKDKLAGFDESTIDIVGALFELMLNDSELTDTLKALLSHLHTPYLKIALRDKDLLENTEHPARRLLDELVSAGETWGSAKQIGEGIFPVMQDIVENLVNNDAPDDRLIEQQRERLAERVKTLEIRYKQRFERTRETEAGKAKLEQAKKVAKAAVASLVEGIETPEACWTFLAGPWCDYLTLLALRNNGKAGSNLWDLGNLLGKRLVTLFVEVTGPRPPTPEEVEKLHKALTSQLGQFIPHYRSEIDKLFDELHRLRSLDRTRSGDLRKAAPRGKPEQTVHPGEELDLSPTEKKTAEQLRKVRAGTRFHIPVDGEEDSQPVTLTWHNPHTDRLLFVDQNGAKVALLPVQQLARYLHTGKARLDAQDKEPFFTRALNAFKSYLEKRILNNKEVAHA